MNRDTFSHRLIAAREHARLSQGDLHDRLRGVPITPRRLQMLELGSTSPSTREMHKLAQVLGVSDLWLMCGGAAGQRFVPDWYVPGGAPCISRN